ncbi:hypothetical protein Tcan_15220 [Toxocara canis]|uniref:Complex I assembly factor TIMMDC1, mitochondrial n=1 Tax=Toxocara canis TaxID=6265 RepID=A0A0B2W1G0_TOXCA|nr:hypothetical protein Tcan_15220 [Toxocara canis]
MERDVTVKMTRMAFAVGTFIGGMSGYATTRQRYEMYSSGRTYLSARDVLRRKWDYGIVMFVKHGFRTGLLSAALVGSVVLLTTHYALWRNRFSAWYFPVVSGANALLLHRASVGTVLSFPLGLMGSLKALGLGISSGLLTTHYALWRNRFSAWYFPVVSGANALLLHRASVGTVLSFPLGLMGSLKALGLGISSGLSLSAVVMLYAISIDKSVDETYAVFKHDYEEELRNEKKREDKLQAFMAEHNIPWRYTAIKKMREEEERRLFEEPD